MKYFLSLAVLLAITLMTGSLYAENPPMPEGRFEGRTLAVFIDHKSIFNAAIGNDPVGTTRDDEAIVRIAEDATQAPYIPLTIFVHTKELWGCNIVRYRLGPNGGGSPYGIPPMEYRYTGRGKPDLALADAKFALVATIPLRAADEQLCTEKGLDELTRLLQPYVNHFRALQKHFASYPPKPDDSFKMIPGIH